MNNTDKIVYKDDDIAIIGLGLHIADTNNLDEYWEIFDNNIDCIRELPKCRREDMEYLAYVYEHIFPNIGNIKYNKASYLEYIDKFDSEFFKISPREAQVMDPVQRILLETVFETFDDAGYTPEMLNGSKTGVYIGYTAGSSDENYSTNIVYNSPELVKYANVGNMSCIVPSRASYILNLQGPTMLIDSACSSSLVSVHNACESIKDGTCTMAIAGGIRLHSFPIVYEDLNVGFETNDNKTRTFDNSASGSAIGEGCACVLLKLLKEAEKDNDHIYAVIKGSAANNDGTSTSITAPNPAAQTRVILDALESSGVSPDRIDYIETHGTATILGDPIEFRGLTSAFKKYTDKKQFCALSSSKSNIGHLYEAAGVAALIKALAAIKYKKIPGSCHFNIPNMKIDFCDSPFYINYQTRNWEKDGLRICGISAFGISGTNCHVVLQEYENKNAELPSTERNILGISAKSMESMVSLLEKYRNYLEKNPCNTNLFAGNVNLYRTQYAKRLAIVFSGRDDLLNILDKLINYGINDWNSIEGVYYPHNENGTNTIDYNKIRFALKRCNTNLLRHFEGILDDKLVSEMDEDINYLASVYSYGAKLDWGLFYKGFEPKHIPIPYYQFKRTRYWLPKREKRDWDEFLSSLVHSGKGDIKEGIKEGMDASPDLYYKRIFIEAEPFKKDTRLGKCLLIRQMYNQSHELFESLKKGFFDVETVQIDNNECKSVGIEKYFGSLYGDIDFRDISHIVIAGSNVRKDSWSAEELLDMHKVQLLSIICLYRELSNHNGNLKVVPIMNSCFSVTGDEKYLDPNSSTVFGLCKSLRRMFKKINSCCVDMDNTTAWDKIADEVCAISQEDIIAYRNNKRYYESLNEVQMETDKNQAIVKDNGIYFISGGLGGIGFETAVEMAKRAKNLTLILAGRSKLPEKSVWDTVLRDNPNSEAAEKIERISSLKAIAENVEYYALDIADADALQKVIKDINRKYGKLNGVIHAAGIGGSIAFEQINEEYMSKMLTPKVAGTYILDRCTRDQDIDFFLMFSSISTIFSSADLPGYIAANIYLDSYSNYRKTACAGKSITINWATWSETGMSVKNKFTIDTLFQSIKTREAINALFTVLSNDSGSTVVARLNLNSKISLLLKTYPMHLSPTVINALKKLESDGGVQAGENTDNSSKYANIEEALIKICRKHLGYEGINLQDNFFELGANSILLAIIFKDLDEVFPGLLQVTDLFSYPTVSMLAGHITNNMARNNTKAEYCNNDSKTNGLYNDKTHDNIKAYGNDMVPAKISPEESIYSEARAVGAKSAEFVEDGHDGIAIIGVGMQLPACSNLEEYWEMLINGINAVREIPSEREVDITKHLLWHNHSKDQIRYMKCGYLDEVNKFDPAFFGISPRDAVLLDPVCRIFLQCCSNAIDDSGYGADGVKGSNTGIFLGYTGNIGNAYSRLLYDMDSKLFESSLTIGQVGMIASRTAYVFDLKGPSMIIDTACSSSLVAVHMACEQIRSKKCDMVLAGGASLMATPLDNGAGIGFESPEAKTRAFADNSSGSAISEGIGVVLLKSLKRAQADGDSIYAVIKGSAINQDGSSFGIAAPNYLAQSEVIQKAWNDAGVSAEDISYIEAHGTGTQLGDPIEIKGINDAFAAYTDQKQICGVGSVKTNIGHANEAAGMCGLFKSILILQNKLIPATLNFQAPNLNIDFINSPLYIVDRVTQPRAKKGRVLIGISSFGMSGTNAHAILEEAPKPANLNKNNVKNPLIFAVSARNEKGVFELIKRYRSFLVKNSNIDLVNFTYTLNIGRKHYPHRLAFIYNNLNDLTSKLNKLSDLESFDRISNDWCFSGHYSIVPESKKDKYPYEITSMEQQRLNQEARTACRRVDRKNIAELQEIIRMYVKGAEVKWSDLYNEPFTKLHLPTYPYLKNHTWYPIPVKEKPVDTVALTFDTFFYNKRWVGQEDIIVNMPEKGETYVVIHGGSNVMDPLSRKIRENGARVIDVFSSDRGFNKKDDDTYCIENSVDGYKKLFEMLSGIKINKIVHTCAYRDDEASSIKELYSEFEYGFFNIINLVKGLMKARFDQKTELAVISCNAYGVTGQEKHILPQNATVLCLGKVIEREYQNICCRAIDADMDSSTDQIFDQLFADHNLYLVCLRQGKSYIEEFDEAEIKLETENRISDGGTYIITGGTSGIGIQTAKLFSKKAKCNLVLLGRKGFPDESLWEEYLGKEEYSERIKDFREIKRNGSVLELIMCDVSNEDDVRKVLESVRRKYKKINGIVHCAGITKPGFILRKEKDDFLSVFSPKIQGTWNLAELTSADGLDFILLNSSNVTDAGEAGQSDYIAANAFLDSYADYLNAQGRSTYCVNWVAWKETGMAYKHGTNVDTVTRAITNSDALRALDQLLRSKPQRVTIGQLNEDTDLTLLVEHSRNSTAPELAARIFKSVSEKQMNKAAVVRQDRADTSPIPQEMEVKGTSFKDIELTGNVEGVYTPVEKEIGKVYGNILGYKEIDIYEGFFKMGGDSILLTEMHESIDKLYPHIVKVADLFEFDSIHSLSEFISSQQGQGKEAESEQPGNASENTREVQSECIYYDMSCPQERIYFDYRLSKNKLVYNIGFVSDKSSFKYEDFIDRANKFLMQFEMFRTTFNIVNKKLVQCVNPYKPVDIERVKVSSLEDIDYMKYLKVFNLSEYPLFNMTFFEAPNKNFLLFDVHHILLDGYSTSLLQEYMVASDRGMELDKVLYPYSKYVNFEKTFFISQNYKNMGEYWQSQFRGFDFSCPLANNNPDDNSCGSVRWELDSELSDLMLKFAKERDTTVFNIFLAAYSLVLSAFINRNDIAILTPVLNRYESEFMSCIGVFTNLIPMRVEMKPWHSLDEFIKSVTKTTVGGIKNQFYQYNHIIRDFKSSNPQFFFYLDFEDRSLKRNRDTEDIPFSVNIPRFTLDLEVKNLNDVYNIVALYKKSYFSDVEVIHFLDLLVKAIKEFCTSSSPDNTLEHLCGKLDYREEIISGEEAV